MKNQWKDINPDESALSPGEILAHWQVRSSLAW